MYYALLYTVVDDYLDRRGQFRDEHLGQARAAHERGDLVLAGAFAEPADGALLVFRGERPLRDQRAGHRVASSVLERGRRPSRPSRPSASPPNK